MSEPRRLLPWLIPPALALAAVGVQFLIDVPHHEMLVDEDKPEPKTTAAARTPREPTPRKWKKRGAEYNKRLRTQWQGEPIASEPIDPRFAEHHEALLLAITKKAEAAAAPDAEPDAIATVATCHTIRCELELCGPPELIDAIAETLPRFNIGRRSVWHELREVETATPKPAQRCRGYIVDFALEGVDARRLAIGPLG